MKLYHKCILIPLIRNIKQKQLKDLEQDYLEVLIISYPLTQYPPIDYEFLPPIDMYNFDKENLFTNELFHSNFLSSLEKYHKIFSYFVPYKTQ